MRSLASVCSLVVMILFSCRAGYSAPYWARSYGGGGEDKAYDMQATSDGGYIVAGSQCVFPCDPPPPLLPASGLWLLKLDASGNTSWQQTYELPGTTSVAYSVQETLDGGYVVAGAVIYDTLLAELPDSDFWVLKLDSDGNVGPTYPGTWQKTYGGSLAEKAFSVYPTSDMGYIVAGYVEANGSSFDVWVVKLDEMGFVSWEKRYGGNDAEGSYSVRETSGGGYVVAGYTKSVDKGDDFWVVKLDEDGTLAWEKAYGGEDDERAFWIEETSSGGYIVTGRTFSFGAGGHDVWVLKLDENGHVGPEGTWQKTYGGPARDIGNSVKETSDGGYIVAGYTDIYVSPEVGWLPDSWLLKLDAAGALVWDQTYGGPGVDVAWSVQESPNHTYVAGGYTDSFGGGGLDAWAVNVKEGGEIADCALIGETAATVSDTDATGDPVRPSASPTSATVGDAEADVQPTSAQVVTQCEEYPGDLDCDETFTGTDVLIGASMVVDLIQCRDLPECIATCPDDMLATCDWDCNENIDGVDVLIGASIIVDIIGEGDTPLGQGCPPR